MRKAISSSFITLPLALITPVVFMLIRNISEFHYESVIYSIFFMTLISCIILLGSFVAHCVYCRIAVGKSKIVTVSANALFAVLFISSLFFPLFIPITIYLASTWKICALFLFSVLFAYGCHAKYSSAFIKITNTFLLIFLSMSLLSGIRSVYTIINSGDVDFTQIDEVVATFPEFKRKPNIYLVWLESVSDLDVIDEYYGTKMAQPLTAALSEIGCRVYSNIYSNSQTTLYAMLNAYSCKLHMIENVKDVPLIKQIIGGGRGNSVYRTLKNNGYFTAFVMKDGDFFHDGILGEYLDSSNYRLEPTWRHYFNPLLSIINPAWFGRLEVAEVSSEKFYSIKAEEDGYFVDSYNFEKDCRVALEKAKEVGKPLFITVKTGLSHTYGDYTYRKKKEWIDSYSYYAPRLVDYLPKKLEAILAMDPDALVIFVGDHGPWLLRGLYPTPKDDISLYEERLRENGESLRSIVDDTFKIFLAIRTPDGGIDLSEGRVITHVNLFRHIFAYLSGDSGILDACEPNTSYFDYTMDVDVVSEGEILTGRLKRMPFDAVLQK